MPFTIGDEVIPSFDVATKPSNRKRAPLLLSAQSQFMPNGTTLQATSFENTRLLTYVCYGLMGYFLLIELTQLLIHGVLKYFKDPWNNLDFFIVIISYVSRIAKGANVDTGM